MDTWRKLRLMHWLALLLSPICSNHSDVGTFNAKDTRMSDLKPSSGEVHHNHIPIRSGNNTEADILSTHDIASGEDDDESGTDGTSECTRFSFGSSGLDIEHEEFLPCTSRSGSENSENETGSYFTCNSSRSSFMPQVDSDDIAPSSVAEQRHHSYIPVAPLPRLDDHTFDFLNELHIEFDEDDIPWAS